MQQLKDKLLSGSGFIAIGSGIACIGSYFLYKNIKETMFIDNIAKNIIIDKEYYEKTQLIGRQQLISILSESKQLVAHDIQSKRQAFLKKSASLLKQQNYEEYAFNVYNLVKYTLDKEQQAIQSLQEHLGLNDDIINHNIVYYNQDLRISNIPFLDELKDSLLQKEFIYYFNYNNNENSSNSKDNDNKNKSVNNSMQQQKNLEIDAISFKYMIEQQFQNILEKNEQIFDEILKQLIELECGINELSPCLFALAYDLFFIDTSYTEYQVKFLRNKFKNIFQNDPNTSFLQELNNSFQKVESSVSTFLRVKHKSSVQKLLSKQKQQQQSSKQQQQQ